MPGFGVSRSEFFDWAFQEPSARSVGDAQLLELVTWSHERSRTTYGAPRVHTNLTQDRGVSFGNRNGHPPFEQLDSNLMVVAR